MLSVTFVGLGVRDPGWCCVSTGVGDYCITKLQWLRLRLRLRWCSGGKTNEGKLMEALGDLSLVALDSAFPLCPFALSISL